MFLSNLFGAVGAGVSSNPFSPGDQSGFSLVLDAAVQYTTNGNLVSVYGTITYPVTASGAGALISLPIAVPNETYAGVVGTAIVGGVTGFAIATQPGTSTAKILNASGAMTNANLSAATIQFFLTYPMS